MKFSLYIAKRYLFSRSKNNAINIITVIAGVGVFAGALALFIVLSGFSGLKAFSLQFTNKVDPDLTIFPKTGKVLTLDSTQLAAVKDLPGVVDYAKVIEERVLLSYQNRNTPAFIKGVDSSFNKVTSTAQSVIAGKWFDQAYNRVVIGSDIARKLSLGISGYGDVLELRVPKPGTGIITDPRKAFNTVNTLVIGVYAINEELNGKYVFAPFAVAQKLLNFAPGEVSSVELKLTARAQEHEADVRQKLTAIFGQDITIKNRIQLNNELYKMLNTENLAVYLIFTLVLIIALFNVGGAIVMAILDKRENIKTLFNLGAETKQIRRIFFLQGGLLTFIGGVVGLAVGVALIVLQQAYSFVMITPSLPYPVQLKLDNVIVVFLTIMVLGFIASYIGSTRVSKALR